MNPILNSKIVGKGKPLLVLHGVFGLSDNWMSFAKVAAENFQTHLVDLRNHGRSFHADEFNFDLMATDVYRYLMHHTLEKVSLMGHSLGGKVAIAFANKYPHLIEKLIIVDIAPKAYPVHHQEIINALKSVNFKVLKSRAEVEKILMTSITDTEVLQFLAKNVYRKNEKELAFRFNIDAIAANIEQIVAESKLDDVIEIDTLFIKGANSNYITNADLEDIGKKFSSVTIETIAKAGHWVHAQNPSDFNKSVLNFLLLDNNL